MASELWAARSGGGLLCLFDGKPEIVDGILMDGPDWWIVDKDMLPDLQPSQRIRVEIVPVKEGEADA